MVRRHPHPSARASWRGFLPLSPRISQSNQRWKTYWRVFPVVPSHRQYLSLGGFLMKRQNLVPLKHTGADESQYCVPDFHGAELNAFSAILPPIGTKITRPTKSKSGRLEVDKSRSHRWQPEPRLSWSRLSWLLLQLAQARVRHVTHLQQPCWSRGLKHSNSAEVL